MQIKGSGTNDKLIIDYSNGNPLPSGGISIIEQAGAGGNQLLLEGTAGTVTYALNSANSGSITVDSTTISFSGLGTIVDDLSAANRSIVVAAGGGSMTLGDGRAAGTAEFTTSSGMTVDFADPTRSLTVDISSQNASASDTLTVSNFHDAGANVVLTGGAFDTINVTTARSIWPGPI